MGLLPEGGGGGCMRRVCPRGWGVFTGVCLFTGGSALGGRGLPLEGGGLGSPFGKKWVGLKGGGVCME